ncbi:MAG: type II toxin-antitoxin system prevent-host-death family antitoxin [Anaerolineae bacterium]|nr:type II toxin-antitoxin system prevent-host-death family antitoxin [Anaerolineae bacterium]
MVAKTVDITSMTVVKDYLLSLLETDTEIILTENGQPVARVLPVEKLPRKKLTGLNRGAMKMHNDFDEPLPDSFWLGNE